MSQCQEMCFQDLTSFDFPCPFCHSCTSGDKHILCAADLCPQMCDLGQAFVVPFQTPANEVTNTLTLWDVPSLWCKNGGRDLRPNWQHPCFQCNCTYLASHLRGSLRGSGLIEHSAAECRGRGREREEPDIWVDIWPITPIAKLSWSLTRLLTRDTFNQTALIAPPLWLTNARNSFLFIEILVIIISQPYSHQPTLMGQIHRFKSVME